MAKKEVVLPKRQCQCGHEMTVSENCKDRQKTTHAKWYAKCERCKAWYDVFGVDRPVKRSSLIS